MDKREKVIKALEECLNASCRGFQPGRYCPIEDDVWEIIHRVATNAKLRTSEGE